MLKKYSVIALALVTCLIASPVVADTSAKTVIGPRGQLLTVSQTINIIADSDVVVSGKNYKTKVGIYVAFCVIPEKGQKPELCSPYDITGQNNNSVWVSSNPPFYAALFVKPFTKNGSFKVRITVRKKIGDYDCKVVKCAILTRADHTKSEDRSADVIVPVNIK